MTESLTCVDGINCYGPGLSAFTIATVFPKKGDRITKSVLPYLQKVPAEQYFWMEPRLAWLSHSGTRWESLKRKVLETEEVMPWIVQSPTNADDCRVCGQCAVPDYAAPRLAARPHRPPADNDAALTCNTSFLRPPVFRRGVHVLHLD